MTCFASIEDTGDTPVMSALGDNGMHETAPCYVFSLGSSGRNNKDNAETCHVDGLGTHMHLGLQQEGNVGGVFTKNVCKVHSSVGLL